MGVYLSAMVCLKIHIVYSVLIKEINLLVSVNLVSSPVIDCGDPGTPTNGQQSLSSTTYNSVVTYTCDVGYTLQGSISRTCQSSGQWSGSVPQCNRKFYQCSNTRLDFR